MDSCTSAMFPFFDMIYLFWANLVKQIKIVCLIWNLAPRLIRICNSDVHFSVFWQKIPFLGKSCSKNQNCQFKVKLYTYTNSKMHNSMEVSPFSILDRKSPFWTNLVEKIKKVSLSWNLVTKLILICRIQWRCSFYLF